MDSEDLLEKARSGDKRAWITWSEQYRPMVSRLAFQAGLPMEEIDGFNRAARQELSKNIVSVHPGNAQTKMLETALRILEKGKFATSPGPEGTIKFAEDLETHHALQSLPTAEKLAVILSCFHGKSEAEIDVLLNRPEANAIDAALLKIREQLTLETDSDVQKRLEFLGKSYDRISFPEEDNYLIEEMHAAGAPSAKPDYHAKSPVKGKKIAVLAGASLFLSAVIGTSFLFNEQPASPQQTAAEEENPTTVTKAMVKNWQAEYQAIRESAPERLGLSQDTFEQLEYVKKADELKERTFSRQNVKQLKDDPERMMDQVEVLMLSIETPKGMLDSIENYSLFTSEVGKFLWLYTDKTEQLMTIADGLLESYKEELSDAQMNGVLSAEKLSYSRGDYPDEIEKLTKALSEYTLQYTVHPNEDRFRTVRDTHKFYSIHPFNAGDMQSTYYLDILQNSPYFDETGMLWPIEQMPHAIMTMAMFMSDPTMDPGLQAKVEPQFVHAFSTMLKGYGEKEVFDSNGVVTDEYRTIWESLLQLDNNPLTYVMLPILEEFEASGWKESVNYDKLGPSTIMHAVALEKKGELAALLPNGDLEVETSSFDLSDYDYSDIKPLYEEFSASYNLSQLSGVDPMEIIKLYYYANKIEDIETMWHLTADGRHKPSLEDYTKQWKKRPEITETLQNIEIYEGNFHRQGREVLLMAMATPVEENYYNYNMPEMILVTERDEIWLMQHQMNEFYARDDNFKEFDANVRAHYENLVNSGDLTTVQHATPAEIGGVFLLAMENEDLESLRMLVNLTDQSIDDEEFKLRWMSMQMPAYSKFGGISFRSDTYNFGMDGVSMRGSINIMNDLDMMDSHYLPMVKVGESWMIEDMFGI